LKKKEEKTIYFDRAWHNLMSRKMIFIPIDAHFVRLSNGVKTAVFAQRRETLQLPKVAFNFLQNKPNF
jgi:hypothetical protein